MMSIAVLMGTEVNSDVTSYEMMLSPYIYQPMYKWQFPSATMATTSAMYKVVITSATNTI